MLNSRSRKQDRMTSKERLEALLDGRKIDRVPFYHFLLGFCARNVGYPIAVMYSDPQKSFQAQAWTFEQYGIDGGPDYGYASYGGWEFGGEIKFPDGEHEQAPSHGSFPVQTEEDAMKLELPDIKKAGCVPLAMEFSRIQEKSGAPISVVFGGNFTIAGNICPVETLCRWMIKKPELARRIIRLSTDYILEIARYWAQTFGAERVIPNIWEPLSTNEIISPRHFEQFVLPYLLESSEEMLKMGIKHLYYHVCGEQNLNLPYWAKIPMGDSGIVSFGHQVDLGVAIEHFGEKNIIVGNVDPQLIQTGTPEQVYQASKLCIEKGKLAPRGYMLMSGCELPPMSPPYNVYMMRKAISDFGWYE